MNEYNILFHKIFYSRPERICIIPNIPGRIPEPGCGFSLEAAGKVIIEDVTCVSTARIVFMQTDSVWYMDGHSGYFMNAKQKSELAAHFGHESLKGMKDRMVKQWGYALPFYGQLVRWKE